VSSPDDASRDRPRRRLFDRATGAPTLVGVGTRLEGRLDAQGPVVVAGEVVGDGVVRGILSVAAGAHWHGDVHAQSAVVAGRITGHVTVDDKLEIGKGAVIRGNVRARQLAIAHGALVDGELQVVGEEPIVRFEEKRASRLAPPGE
jgi:cytoskeletal protein CcmA (bactofilin family)